MEKTSLKKHIYEPPCTITEVNKPNIEVMAKAFLNLYKQTKKSKSVG